MAVISVPLLHNLNTHSEFQIYGEHHVVVIAVAHSVGDHLTIQELHSLRLLVARFALFSGLVFSIEVVLWFQRGRIRRCYWSLRTLTQIQTLLIV